MLSNDIFNNNIEEFSIRERPTRDNDTTKRNIEQARAARKSGRKSLASYYENRAQISRQAAESIEQTQAKKAADKADLDKRIKEFKEKND